MFHDRRPGSRPEADRRIGTLAQRSHPRDVLAALRRDAGAQGIVGALPILRHLDRLITQAGSTATISRALLWMASCGALSFVLLRLMTALPPLPALMLAATFGLGLPILYLMCRKARRLRRFEAQLPGALDLLVRGLRAGHPINAALASVAEGTPDPLGSEFGIVADEVAYGRALDEALERMHERIDLPDLRHLTIALQIQGGDSGNLAEVLAGLARMGRDRLQTFRKTGAAAADGR